MHLHSVHRAPQILHGRHQHVPVIGGGREYVHAAGTGVPQLFVQILHQLKGLVHLPGKLFNQGSLRPAGQGAYSLPLGVYSLRQALYIPAHSRQHLLAHHANHGEGLDVQGFYILLHNRLIPGLHLRLGIDFMPGKQLNVFLIQIPGQSVHRGGQVEKPPALCLLHPLWGVAVAIEDNALVGCHHLAHQFRHPGGKLPGAFQEFRKLPQLLRHNGVKHNVGAGNGDGRA